MVFRTDLRKDAFHLNLSGIFDKKLVGLLGKVQDCFGEDLEKSVLNKLSPEEVHDYKKKIDEMHKKNLKKPGDTGLGMISKKGLKRFRCELG